MSHSPGESSSDFNEKITVVESQGCVSEIDFTTYHEECAGRLVLDPKEAHIEFGDTVASRLKLSPDGNIVLWPQPSDDPEDPQNWSEWHKTVQLTVVILASIVADFDSGIGIAALFALAKQYNTTTSEIINLTSKTDGTGWGGLFAVMIIRRYGRLPVLFWSQLLALGFLVGCTFAPNLKTFAGRTCPQVTGLYVVTDMYPFHRQARMINIWTMGFMFAPFLSPFAFGFLVSRANWRWTYGIGCMYSLFVIFIIACFGRETMYDRGLKNLPSRQTGGLRYRIETLVGMTGAKMAKYRVTWYEAVSAPFKLVWRPHLLSILVFEAVMFGFDVGVNYSGTLGVRIFSRWYRRRVRYAIGCVPIVGSLHFRSSESTTQVAVIIGEIIGHFLNDAIMRITTRRNGGVFEAESRLWACYVAVPLYVCGFVVLGVALKEHNSVPALVIGWGLLVVAVMINTVAVYAYTNDCFPRYQGEISALQNLSRVLGGFSVAYFQVPWATKHGALQTLGCEAAIVAGLFVLIVPTIQLTGRTLRNIYSTSPFRDDDEITCLWLTNSVIFEFSFNSYHSRAPDAFAAARMYLSYSRDIILAGIINSITAPGPVEFLTTVVTYQWRKTLAPRDISRVGTHICETPGSPVINNKGELTSNQNGAAAALSQLIREVADLMQAEFALAALGPELD
ncbi:Major facilitator superfamily domain containing protein [Russula decolorans]